VNEMGLKIEKSEWLYWINFDIVLMISQWISNKFMLLINNTIKLKENEIKVLKNNFLKNSQKKLSK
jgi:hypothetical protein